MAKAAAPAESFSIEGDRLELLGDLTEEEQIAHIIKLHQLPPVADTELGIWITGLTRTDWYEVRNTPGFPPPIGGRRSNRSPEKRWTVDLVRWRVRLASSGKR